MGLSFDGLRTNGRQAGRRIAAQSSPGAQAGAGFRRGMKKGARLAADALFVP
jgi:hypothetical protein